ncbi:G1/S-specific cyclin Pcl5 [Apiospora rasikravindrae]|uniref:G1/S-specific cyclin Pcl5 n=1 Tax=Apiospora rasikravindrae TaxID=990691 RepID=A0ABR1S1X0_9PEZI
MMCSDNDSLAFIKSLHHGPYNSSLASSASSSSASVWSDASSQHSDDTSITAPTSDVSEPCDSYCNSQASISQAQITTSWVKQAQQPQLKIEVPQETRQNPRRTSNRPGCPPVLMRQSDRKVNFVDNLVDSSTQIVEAIWPLSSVVYRAEMGSKAVLPLRTFIQETLRRSRTSYSTLQVALYYLILIKPHVPKHDFTMEQPDDIHSSRVLQCGRRMFLAALILASKYLQDRNYSARAWSKISGLATQEINQNEMAFLLAVNWKLHITDDVFQRWTEIVLKYIPSQPPSPGALYPQAHEREVQEWKNLILRLNPGLDNIEGLLPSMSMHIPARQEVSPVSPGSALPASRERAVAFGCESNESTPTPRSYQTPMIMEPSPATVYASGHHAPALGLLPTPRLTPQMTGFSTPAVNAASCLLGARGSMGFAMAQVSNVCAAQTLDRWPGAMGTSPQGYSTMRRSSLANSISTASSPESMISDSSRTSRSSSISSASSLVNAPSTKLDVQARCRYAKLCNERYSARPAIASVPEDYEENCLSSSPESYTGPMGKDLLDMSLDTTLARTSCEADDAADAARALQELHNYHRTHRVGSKRSRPLSIDNSLQENVRELLCSQQHSSEPREWSVNAMPSHNTQATGRKRVCYASDVPTSYSIPSLHPAVGGAGGPGMWDGILN